MRTIKFRGKRCDNSEWVCGDYVEFTETWKGGHPHKCWIVTSARSNGGFFALNGRYPVQNQTIGQFTGLHDKNGKEIYEGDIINFTNVDYPDCEIIFNNASFVCNEIGEDNIVCELRLGFVNEVIGNIHDNPELLKGGKE